MYADVFQSMLVLSFGLTMLGSGLFTAYFGAGKSRRIGLGLLLVGLLSVFFFAAFSWGFVPALSGVAMWQTKQVYTGIVAVAAASVGVAVASVIFLGSIMRV